MFSIFQMAELLSCSHSRIINSSHPLCFMNAYEIWSCAIECTHVLFFKPFFILHSVLSTVTMCYTASGQVNRFNNTQGTELVAQIQCFADQSPKYSVDIVHNVTFVCFIAIMSTFLKLCSQLHAYEPSSSSTGEGGGGGLTPRWVSISRPLFETDQWLDFFLTKHWDHWYK